MIQAMKCCGKSTFLKESKTKEVIIKTKDKHENKTSDEQTWKVSNEFDKNKLPNKTA